MTRGPTYTAAHRGGERLGAAVLLRLSHDELTACQLAERLGVQETTLRDLLRRLHREGRIAAVSYTRRDIKWRAVA